MTENEDPRLNHIKITTLKLLNVSDNQWAELIWQEENQSIIQDFLETPSTIFLLVLLDQNEKLVLCTEMLSPHAPKMVAYFMKNNTVVSSENFKEEIVFGRISSFPVEQYQNLFENVWYPIFSNPLNNRRWPAEIADDIILHFQDFRKILTYHVGLAKGQTVLVISETAKMIENYDINKIFKDQTDLELQSIINAITDMICDWIPIIKEVLGVTSESILLKVQQGPATEIKFWKDRKKNLEFIQRQLNDAVIEKMLFALEKTDNIHYPLFKSLLQDVVEALAEAKEISESLSLMSNQLEKLETCEFSKLKEDLPEAMKTITSSWTKSKYFSRVPSRISILIKKSCFFLIEKVEGYLNPSELFKANESEMKLKVKMSIETCDAFLLSYSDCRKSYSKDSKIYPWEFPDQRVFDSLENFLGKLNKIYEIFEASALYCSIPDYKIVGVQHAPFKVRLDELSATFKEYYQIFVESTYNPLDLKSDVFIKDYNVFSSKVDELDYKLGTTLSQACMSCITSEDCFKLMNLIQNLLKRPLVNMEFQKLIRSLLKSIYMELHAAKESYDKLLQTLESNNPIIYKNLPTASGELQWSIDLQKKLAFPIDSLQQIQHYYINTDDVNLILRTYRQMNELLENFQSEIFSKWKVALDTVKKQLNEPLFSECGNNLILNFSPQILDIAQEIQYIKMIKKTDLLPPDALSLHDTLKKVLLAHALLACTARWYNDLSKNLKDFEKALIKDDWEKICEDLETGLEKQWTKSDLQEYSENVYTFTKSLHERVYQANENITEVQKFMETWNKSPVFVRETPNSLVTFEMFMTPKMREQMYHVMETSINMNRAMEENMLLFKSDPETDEWKKYVLYLDSIIENGLKNSVQCSLQYLLENTNALNKKLAPFYKIRMILKEEIAFVPPLDRKERGSFFELFESVLDRIYSPASEVKRFADTETDYAEALAKDSDLNSLKLQLIQQIESGISNILAQLVNYEHYSEIWKENIETVLEDFILYGPLPVITPEEEEEIESTDIPLEIKPPTEEEFRTEIIQFDMLQKKIEDIPSEILIQSWLVLDTTLFKESLSSLIKNWSVAYKKKLVELKSQDKLRKIEDDGD